MSEHGEIIIENHRYAVQADSTGCGQFLISMGALTVISVVALVVMTVT